jgi:hypothetical protein
MTWTSPELMKVTDLRVYLFINEMDESENRLLPFEVFLFDKPNQN